MQHFNYFDGWRELEVVCGQCSWRGTGAATAQGELFRDLVERDCPQCGDRIVLIVFPTDDEVRSTAAAGNLEAAEMLKRVEHREARQARWEVERLESEEQLPNLEDPVIKAVIAIGRDADGASGESQLELSLNGGSVHLEPGFFETLEPLRRILPLLRAKYGQRLISVDISGAFTYLHGDHLGGFDEQAQIFADSGFDSDGRSFVANADRKSGPTSHP